jgi:dihydropyrimidinase
LKGGRVAPLPAGVGGSGYPGAMETIIKGGTIVTANDTYEADIGISGEVIVAIAEHLEAQEAEVVDAGGKLVLPGGIDPHTHLDLPVGATHTADDFFTGSVAAAAGGTTTLIDMAIPGEEGPRQTVAIWNQRTEKCAIDYSYHIVLTHIDEAVFNEVRELAEEGLTSLKIYMPFPGLMLNSEQIMATMALVAELGLVVTLHAESESITHYLTDRLLKAGRVSLDDYPEARPPVGEVEAVNRAIAIAQAAGCPIYFVHQTTDDTLAAIQEARACGRPVYAETCPHYLLLDPDLLKQERREASKYMTGPPLRNAAHREALWAGLRNGDIQVVSTDHCAWNTAQKDVGDTFADVPVGLPGIETRLPLLYTEAVGKRGFSVNEFVALASTNAARIFGLFPQKGTVAIGSDADLALWDPDKEVTLSAETLHQDVDYCPFEGHRLRGYPTLTMLRGNVIFKDGEFVGSRGSGQQVPRRHHPTRRLL